ncbi:MAG: hypothetical protein CMJ62_13685 [Planctomycetaceae bacterium]|nr:hypothetical protein [Planctomycetaceae bacterium]
MAHEVFPSGLDELVVLARRKKACNVVREFCQPGPVGCSEPVVAEQTFPEPASRPLIPVCWRVPGTELNNV